MAFLTDLVLVMLRLVRSLTLLILFSLVGVPALHAQETDTTAADTTVTDTSDTMPADTTVTETAAADTAVVDTAAADTMTATRRVVGIDTVQVDSTVRVAVDSIGLANLKARRDSIAALQAAAKRTARRHAEEWLALTDAGAFAESWDAADTTFQKGVSRGDWIDQGRRLRNRLDTMRSRKLSRAEYRDSLRRVPGRRPVVLLEYATRFDRGRTLEAVVTTKRDTVWKVAGYRVVAAPSPVADTTEADTVEADTTETDEEPE